VGGDWVAPGRPDGQGNVGIWFSSNGLDWTQSATLPTGLLGAYPALDDVFSAGGEVFVSLAAARAGQAGLHPGGVWTSTDGTTWNQLDISPEIFASGAAASDTALVLAGVTPGVDLRSSFWVLPLR
jgi:hypothetical protein